jgi:hypothetical protein
MAEAMVAAADEPVACGKERVDRAAARTWDRRADAWLTAVPGPAA